MRLIATSSGSDPSALRPGHELVMHATTEHCGDLAHGVLLDDWLGPEERVRTERAAVAALSDWRARYDRPLTVGGICLPAVYEILLFTDVFLPLARIGTALRAVLGATGVERLELCGVRPDLGAWLAAETGLEVSDSGTAEAQRKSSPLRRQGDRAFAGTLRGAAGMPKRVRGSVILQPYRHLGAVVDRLTSNADLLPVLDPGNLPPLPLARLGGLARRGGWIGYPGARQRRRSRRQTERALDPLWTDAPITSTAGLAHRWSLELLDEVAPEGVATMAMLRSAFASGARTVLLGTGSSPFGRIATAAAGEAGRLTVEVQHGFFGLRPEPPWPAMDCLGSGRVAVWTDRDARYFERYADAPIAVTGNPGAIDPSTPRATGRVRRETLLLAQPPSVATLTLDVRTTVRHLLTGLRAVARARPGSTVTVRPHPLDREHDAYASLAARVEDVDVRVEATGSVYDALARCDLCLGAVSTATLEAAALGVPTGLIDPSSATLSWPLDGSAAFPVARDDEQAAAMVADLQQAHEPPGSEQAREALGARPDAVERVVELIADASRG